MLSCRALNGVQYLVVDMLEPCNDGRWIIFVGVIVLPSLFLFVLGLPIFSFVYMYRIHRNRKENLVQYRIMQFRVGLLFSGFHVEKWWWEGMVALRKMVFILIATFGKDDTNQVHYALAFLAFFVAAHIAANPFDSRRSHVLEIMSLTSLCFLLWVSVFFRLEDQCSVAHAGRLHWCAFLGFSAIATNLFFLMFAMIMFLKAWCKKHHLDEKIQEFGRKISLKSFGRPSYFMSNNQSNDNNNNDDNAVELSTVGSRSTTSPGEAKVNVENPFVSHSAGMLPAPPKPIRRGSSRSSEVQIKVMATFEGQNHR